MENIADVLGYDVQLQIQFDEKLETKFQEYHADYPEVYETFKKLTLETIAKGFKRFSARGVFQVMRWLKGSHLKSDGFKYNNNYTPMYARMFEQEFPEHKDFFEKRRIKKSK